MGVAAWLALLTALAGVAGSFFAWLPARNAARAGRAESERDRFRATESARRDAASIDSEVRRLDDAGLTDEVREKWSRD